MAKTATRTPAPCGTPGAHTRHRRRGEPIDEACRAGRRAYDNARRSRARAARRAGIPQRETAAAIAAAQQRRETRIVRLPGASMPLGALACSAKPHDFMPDGETGSQCLGCFGWRDDPRHTDRLAAVAS